VQQKIVLVTDFDNTIVPPWEGEPCSPTAGYYHVIDHVKTHQIAWYGSTGRTFDMVVKDPLLNTLDLHAFGCNVGTELWLRQPNGTYQQCSDFVEWLDDYQQPGLIPFDVDQIKNRVAPIVGELDAADKPIFVLQPEKFQNRHKVCFNLQQPALLEEYLTRFDDALVGISHKIISYHGVSHFDEKTPNAMIEILHPRASKSSTTAFCEREHPDSLIIFAGDSGNDVGAVDPHNPKHRIIVVGNAHDDFRQWVLDNFPPDRCFIGDTEQHQEADAVIAGLRHFHLR
jgi:hypothetical protein